MAVSPSQDRHPQDDLAFTSGTRVRPNTPTNSASGCQPDRLRHTRIPTRPRRTLAVAVTIAAISAATAACGSPTHTAASAAAAAHTTTATSTQHAKPTCTTTFAGGSGITVQHGEVTAAVTLHCNGAPDAPLISLTLAYVPPGKPLTDELEAAGRTFQDTQATYTVSAACHQSGTYALHVLYGASVDGTALANGQWGSGKTVTADDCDGAS